MSLNKTINTLFTLPATKNKHTYLSHTVGKTMKNRTHFDSIQNPFQYFLKQCKNKCSH